ncbi:MAG: hypothetical protein DRJ05_04650, partial [Bacteroidetes bacterium]
MRNIFLFCLIVVTVNTYGQDYNLNVRIDGLPAKEVYLADFYGDQNHILDTTLSDTLGVFSFKLKENYPAGMYRVFLEKKVCFDIIYNNENIEIDTQSGYLYD